MLEDQEKGIANEITPQEWEWVQELIHDLERDGDDGCKDLLKSLLEWDSVVRAFRKTEVRRMIQRTPTEQDLELHGFCLHALLAAGRSILLQAREMHLRVEGLGYRIRDIEAYIGELEQDLREWHTHGLTEAEVKEAQRIIFEGGATEAHR